MTLSQNNNKNPGLLHRDSRKVALKAFLKLASPDPFFSSRVLRSKVSERLSLENSTSLGYPAWIVSPEKLFLRDSFHHVQLSGHLEVTKATIQMNLLIAELMIDLVIVPAILTLLLWRTQELWGHGGFHLVFKGRPKRPGNVCQGKDSFR